MKTELFNGCEINLIEPQKILFIKFSGNLTDDEYKEVWNSGIDKGKENGVSKFIFDQSTVGKVSFSARGWAVLKALPRIKNELNDDIKVGILQSKDIINKSGVKYLVSMFEKMTSFDIEFYENLESAIEALEKK